MDRDARMRWHIANLWVRNDVLLNAHPAPRTGYLIIEGIPGKERLEQNIVAELQLCS
jgi:hypothetical protein